MNVTTRRSKVVAAIRGRSGTLAKKFYIHRLKQPTEHPKRMLWWSELAATTFEPRLKKSSRQLQQDSAVHPHIQLDLIRSTRIEVEVKKIISSMSCKSSPRDCVATTLVKDCSSVFSVIITRLANLSFTEGVFPSFFKTAQISQKSRPRPSCPEQLPTHI